MSKIDSLQSILVKDPNERKAIAAPMPKGPYFFVFQHDIGKIPFDIKWDEFIKYSTDNRILMLEEIPPTFLGHIIIANNEGHPAICAYHYDTSD